MFKFQKLIIKYKNLERRVVNKLMVNSSTLYLYNKLKQCIKMFSQLG